MLWKGGAMPVQRDLTGQRFGKLMVLEKQRKSRIDTICGAAAATAEEKPLLIQSD